MKGRADRGREIAVRLTDLQRTACAYAAERDNSYRVGLLVEAAFAYVAAVEGNERRR